MWQLEEDSRVIAVGDEVSFSLVLEEVAAETSDAGVETVRGNARALPSWPSAQGGRHPVRIDVGGGAVYFGAPTPIEGPVEVVGRVVSDDVDWPEATPATRGVVRRVRMEWSERVQYAPGTWGGTSTPPRYEDVPATYLPDHERPSSPDDDATMHRQVEHPRPEGGAKGARSFVTLGWAARPEVPIGTTRIVWTGVLIDLEITGLDPV
jgi:hypothetical protein